MTLLFKDGYEVELTDNSTIEDCIIVVPSLKVLATIQAKFTAENLTGATLDGVVYENIVPVKYTVECAYGDNAIVHFTNRKKTTEEIQGELINELQLAVAELTDIVGGEE